MPDFYHVLDRCLLCAGRDLQVVVPLRPMPIATPNFRVAEADRDGPAFTEAVPLDLVQCRACGHLQVGAVGNPQFQYTNYVYRTSLSLGLREHFRSYADEVTSRVGPPADGLAVELGSNDGTLLRFFRDKGLRVLGVDPAGIIAARATEEGLPTIPDFFSRELARKIGDEHGPAHLVVANNMIANVEELEALTSGVRDLLAPDGVFVLETQYGADVVKRTLLDTVYHEHLSYFLIRPLQAFLDRLGLELIDVRPIATKGGSFRATAQHAGGPRRVEPAVASFIESEVREGLYEPERYARLSDEIAAIRRDLAALVDGTRAAGRGVAGYGVSVGTTTLLAQFDLADRIDFLVDDDPDKESHLVGPGYRIPVLPRSALLERRPGLVIVFAWRYAGPIVDANREFRDQGGRFVVPLPRVEVR